MIVMRYSFQIKPGKFNEALKLAKQGKENVRPNLSSRISTSNIGPLNTTVFENEHKDNAEREKSAEEIGKKDEWSSWLANWSQVITGEGKTELWNLEQFHTIELPIALNSQ